GRHAPSVLNSAFGTVRKGATVWQFWDGRKDSLWSQALGPPENPNEMGTTRTQVALLIFDKYQAAYAQVFGAMPALRGELTDAASGASPAGDATAQSKWQALSQQAQTDVDTVYSNFGKAIAAYERRLVDRDSLFDSFRSDLLEDP